MPQVSWHSTTKAKRVPLCFPVTAVPGSLQVAELTEHNFLGPEYVLLSSLKCVNSNQVKKAGFSKGDLCRIR